MESKKIALSTTTPLANRIGETGRQLRNWLNSLDTPFEQAVDKVQLKKREVKHGQCVYHYVIVRGLLTVAPEAQRKTTRNEHHGFRGPV